MIFQGLASFWPILGHLTPSKTLFSRFLEVKTFVFYGFGCSRMAMFFARPKDHFCTVLPGREALLAETGEGRSEAVQRGGGGEWWWMKTNGFLAVLKDVYFLFQWFRSCFVCVCFEPKRYFFGGLSYWVLYSTSFSWEFTGVLEGFRLLTRIGGYAAACGCLDI